MDIRPLQVNLHLFLQFYFFLEIHRIAINRLKWPLSVAPFFVCLDKFKQQYTSCMKDDSGENLGSGIKYSKKLFGPMFYSWCNCPLMMSFDDYVLERKILRLAMRFLEWLKTVCYRDSLMTTSRIGKCIVDLWW